MSHPAAQKTANWIRLGLLLLLAIMPVHAFLSVTLGHYFGHEAIFQAWKEALLLVLALLGGSLLFLEPKLIKRLKKPWIIFAAIFGIIAVLVTLITRPPVVAVAFGLKTDLEFLLAGVLAALVADELFIRRAMKAVLLGSIVVIFFGLLQAFALPPDFLVQFGYGPSTIAPFQHITNGTSNLRFPSTLGGANQLGTYLILPICLALVLAVRSRRWQLYVLPALGLVALGETFSRSAWIGAAVAVILTILLTMPRQLRKYFAYGLSAAMIILAFYLPVVLSHDGPADYLIYHTNGSKVSESSDQQHALSLRQGLSAVSSAPLGHGLGTAGPATFHAGHGNIIEDFYLQIGYETGYFGLLAFLCATLAILVSLWRKRSVILAIPAAAAIIGVSLAALVLPAWADSSTAIILWIVAGASSGYLVDSNEHRYKHPRENVETNSV